MFQREVKNVIPYRRQKIDNAIAYFASEYKKRRDDFPYQTWIYKALAFLDFRVLRIIGSPCLELDYVALKDGPVPQEFYDTRAFLPSGEAFRFIQKDYAMYQVEATKAPDLYYFSEKEIDVMDAIVAEYAAIGVPTRNMIHDIHKENRAWQKAWERAQGEGVQRSPMKYEEDFDDLETKKERDLTPEEEHFLVHQALSELEKRQRVTAS